MQTMSEDMLEQIAARKLAITEIWRDEETRFGPGTAMARTPEPRVNRASASAVQRWKKLARATRICPTTNEPHEWRFNGRKAGKRMKYCRDCNASRAVRDGDIVNGQQVTV